MQSKKYLVVDTTVDEKDTNHEVETMSGEVNGETWKHVEESWGPVELSVVDSFDSYSEADRKASMETFYALVSVYNK